MIPRPLVFFDLETAGLDPDSEIIQLSALAIEYPTWTELPVPFNAKIEFDITKAHPHALEINHYDREVWARDAEPLYDVLQNFSRWLGNYKSVRMTSKTGRPYWLAQLVGYNSESFDLDRLKASFRAHDIFFPAHYRTLDVLQLAAWDALENGEIAPSLRLSDVCTRHGIDTTGAHDALADVRMTVGIAQRILGGV